MKSLGLVNDPTLSIDDNRYGDGVDHAVRHGYPAVIQQNRVMHSKILNKAPNFVGILCIHGDTGQHQALVFQFIMHLVELGDLRLAHRSGRQKEVQQDNFSLVLGKLEIITYQIFQNEIRSQRALDRNGVFL